MTLHQILLFPLISWVIRSASPSSHVYTAVSALLCCTCPILPGLSLPCGHYKAHPSRPLSPIEARVPTSSLPVPFSPSFQVPGGKAYCSPTPSNLLASIFDLTFSLEHLHPFPSPSKTTITSLCLKNKPPTPGTLTPKAAH